MIRKMALEAGWRVRDKRKDGDRYIRWKTIYENRIDGALNEDICNGTGKLGRDDRNREQNSLLLMTEVPAGEWRRTEATDSWACSLYG